MRAMPRVMEIAETQITDQLARSRIIALGTFEVIDHVRTAGEALLRGGVGCLEIANPTIGLLRAARRVEGLIVGAGHVQTPEQAEAALQGGAHFATAPATNMEVIHACRELELPFFPGVATPSEIERLAILGLRTLRVFPAAPLGGPAFLQAVSAIYPELQFIPAGGIGPETLRQYLQIPAVLAVAAGGLVRGDLLRARNFERIAWLARDAQRAHR
jgi:2-dehydro-3-deoxyphosphogluconate aldolase / (4S)-4-hydroxy-2-oxoglutarate aldolase